MPDELIPEDTVCIIVRRGEDMRVLLPVHKSQLWKVFPHEIAWEAAITMMKLQEEYPGRANMPVVIGDRPMGLTIPGSDYVLDPDTWIGPQLMDRWELMDVPIAAPGAPTRQLPCCVLNLDDILD